jgi:thioredoxin reductase (NADPH)
VFEVGRQSAAAGVRHPAEAGIRHAGRPIRVECTESAVKVTVEGGAPIDLDVLYPALGCEVRSELATTIGADCTEQGNLKVDEHQLTTVDCLYAAGDVVSDLHQLAVATGHAGIAATAIHNRLAPNPR